MDGESTVNGAAEQGLRLLDKVTEFRFALALLSVVIAFDVALSWIANRNVLTMDWSALGASDITRIGLAMVAYVFWMAALSPLVRHIVEYAFMLLENTRLSGMLNRVVEPIYETAERRYASGQVRVNEAKLRALRDKDAFWIARVEKAEARQREERDEMVQLAGLSFSVSGLLLMDWWMDSSLTGLVTAWVGEFGGPMGSVASLGAWVCILLVAFPWLYRMRVAMPSETWIDHPELARERLEAIEAQRRNARL